MNRACRGLLVACLACFAGSAMASRPLTVTEAEPVGPGQLMLELGVGHCHDPGSPHLDVPVALTWGFRPRLSITAGLGGVFEERTEADDRVGSESGLADLTLTGQWMYAGESGWLPAQAVCPSLKLPTADENRSLGSGKTDYDLTWLASKSLGARANAHLNLGYSWIGSPAGQELGDLVHGGAAVDYQLNRTLQCAGEVCAERERADGAATVVNGMLALRWEAVSGLLLDLGAGSTLRGEGPSLITTLGLSWTFGPGADDEP